MQMHRHNILSYSAMSLAIAGAVLLAGCASGSGGSTSGAGSSAAASGAAAAPAPAPEPSAPQALDYADVKTALAAGAERARQDLVGRDVNLELKRATGRGAPAGTFMVETAGDNVFFRCQTTARGFRGGSVNTEIRAVRVPAKGARVVDLARCSTEAAEPRAAAPAAAPKPTPAPAAAASGGAGNVGAGKPGMDARGNVVDSSKVEAGSGRTVKGLNNYEGEISGNPAGGSKFTRLQIGMPMKQVTDLIGSPTDQGAYITGKAWIPFYFGGDRYRHEMVYKGQGRLIFAGGSMGDFTSGHLIWIIHNANEAGYR